jgi:YD repeat-containing protein
MLSVLLTIPFFGLCQTPDPMATKLPQYVPPTPNVASVMKNGELSATPHTGGASASIPLYEIKLKDFSFPISLNYQTTGFKPDEIPGAVGIGWSLSAFNMLTRSIQGKPDDETSLASQLTLAQLTNPTTTQELNEAIAYMNSVADPLSYQDTRPDEYRFSIGGASGKFFYLKDQTILKVPYSNLKIEPIWGGAHGRKLERVIITDTKGVKYYFGYDNVYEETKTHNLEAPSIQRMRTSWFLTKIVTPLGNEIRFNYAAKTVKAVNGYEEWERVFYEIFPGCTDWSGLPSPPECQMPQNQLMGEKYSTIEYDTYFLSSIQVIVAGAEYLNVDLSYENRPDISGDNRLKNIFIHEQLTGTIVKSIGFEYSNTQNDNQSHDVNKRFFLKKVTFYDTKLGNTSTAPKQEYKLEYNDQEGVAERFSKSIDYLGYSNGSGNSSLLTTKNTIYEEEFSQFANANRDPNGQAAAKGLLKKIVYPTGGYDEFTYEPNMSSYWGWIFKEPHKGVHLEGIGNNTNGEYYQRTFSIPANALSHKAYFYFGSQDLSSTGYYNSNRNVEFWVYETATNINVLVKDITGFGMIQDSLDLTPGVSYTMKMHVRTSDQNFGTADAIIMGPKDSVWGIINKELCGVRVRKISSYDPFTNKSVNKFYKYWSLTDTIIPSAIQLYNFYPISHNYFQNLCTSNNGGQAYVVNTCDYLVLSSNSASTSVFNDAGPVVYKWVIESDDSTWAHGGIEHSFYCAGGIIGVNALGNTEGLFLPVETDTYMNGKEGLTRYFNANRIIVKTIINSYSQDSRASVLETPILIIQKRYDPITSSYSILDLQAALNPYNVSQYYAAQTWWHLDYTSVADYDPDKNVFMLTSTNYEYNSESNIAVSKIVTSGSDYTCIEKEMQYPNYFTGLEPYQTMTNRNQLENTIHENTYKNFSLIYANETEYSDWFNNQTRFYPVNIKTQKESGNLETRITFSKYDTHGNVLELSKANDVTISYIWDYRYTLPIAEVTNASHSDIAYTSFEADGKGGWTYSGSPTFRADAPTGKWAYSLLNNPITASPAQYEVSFIVTYWARDGFVNVNGGDPGSPVLTKNDWSLYKTFASGDPITISGTALIDELRLYPTNAFMKTYCYAPEVGVTDIADANALISKYEYDGFGRLTRIADVDGNTIKKAEYKYGERVGDCQDVNPNWNATGEYRCAINNEVNNNYTGVREKEEIDINNCSPSYLEKRWTPIGVSTVCPSSVSNCSGPDKRVINGVCVTGQKVYVTTRYISGVNWECVFHYEWPQDGFVGPEFIETHPYPCEPYNN